MKRISILPVIFLFLFGAERCFAQNDVHTAVPFTGYDYFFQDSSREYVERMDQLSYSQVLAENPQWNTERAAYEAGLQNAITAYKTTAQAQSVIIIPVVIHILWHDSIENIPDNQVYSQLEVLNKDFMRLNADTVNTPAAFNAVAGNPMIQFCLAHYDPNGAPTTGIERRNTSLTMFTGYDHPQLYSGGGLDQWDPTRYFNIWVCNSIYLGKGEFPLASTTNTFGVIVDYSNFGSNYTSYGTFPALTDPWGRIATHEIGHCFDLHHPYGDDLNDCTGTDYCADTPDQQGAASGCPSFPLYDSCTPSGSGVMFENFMDYSSSACKNLFTIDQCARMYAVLHSPPYDALAYSNACNESNAIQEIPLAEFSLHPNPVINTLNISFGKKNESFFQLNIYDELGNCVMNKIIAGDQDEVDVSSLASGMYFVMLTNEKMNVVNRFIKL
jgi:hypothetical protein